MKRVALAAALALLPLVAHAQGAQQALVDRATLTVQEMTSSEGAPELVSVLHRARAVLVCPRIFRAGFVLGGAGGGCVLVARDGGGSWSAPAFFDLANGSVGFQIGVQDSEMIMAVMTDRGLSALLDRQFKIGGDVAIAVATAGAGVDQSTSDIIAYSKTRGLFAGMTLNGGLLATDTDADQAYYGRPYGARGIVIQMEANNPGADPLRAILTRVAAPVATAQAMPMQGGAPPDDMEAPPPRAPGRLTPVRRMPLPPPPPPR